MPTIEQMKAEISIQQELERDLELINTIQRHQTSFGLFTHIYNEEPMNAQKPSNDLRRRIMDTLEAATADYSSILMARRTSPTVMDAEEEA